MANPPPPYDNITGISRAVMKDNAQETLAEYDGNARPGELVVDLTQDPPPLYVGNNIGQLTLVASGGATTWALLGDKDGEAGPVTIALGQDAGQFGQAASAIALGQYAGQSGQGAAAIAIGLNASGNDIGNITPQGANAVAIGAGAGYNAQGTNSIAIGSNAGQTSQGGVAVAIGQNAGNTSQGDNTVAIGTSAGRTSQGTSATAVGSLAGSSGQGILAVAIGGAAGETGQGVYSVAVGGFAGQTSQANNSIVLNATGSALNQTTANTFTVKPVRNGGSSGLPGGFYQMAYNPTTGEIVYYT